MVWRIVGWFVAALALVVIAPAAGPASAVGVWVEESVQVDTGTGTLYGSLLLPAADPPNPVVLIVAGSGPTDRNGNTKGQEGKNDSLLALARALAKDGIASLRFDKRGVGESALAAHSEAMLRFEHYVDDAAAWARRLRDDKRFSAVFLAGHSEGSLIGMLVAQKTSIQGFVSLGGPALTGGDLFRQQLKATKLPQPFARRSDEILAALELGKTVDDVPAELQVLYRPSVQPYEISWFRYQPKLEIAKLSQPVLIIHGLADQQIPSAQAEQLALAHPGAELALIPGMNHLLKQTGDDLQLQCASHTDPSVPMAARAAEALSAFVRRNVPSSPASR